MWSSAVLCSICSSATVSLNTAVRLNSDRDESFHREEGGEGGDLLFWQQTVPECQRNNRTYCSLQNTHTHQNGPFNLCSVNKSLQAPHFLKCLVKGKLSLGVRVGRGGGFHAPTGEMLLLAWPKTKMHSSSLPMKCRKVLKDSLSKWNGLN